MRAKKDGTGGDRRCPRCDGSGKRHYLFAGDEQRESLFKHCRMCRHCIEVETDDEEVVFLQRDGSRSLRKVGPSVYTCGLGYWNGVTDEAEFYPRLGRRGGGRPGAFNEHAYLCCDFSYRHGRMECDWCGREATHALGTQAVTCKNHKSHIHLMFKRLRKNGTLEGATLRPLRGVPYGKKRTVAADPVAVGGQNQEATQ